MDEMIKHYGGTVVALFAIVALLLITAGVVTTISQKTDKAVSDLQYESDAAGAVQAGQDMNNPTQAP